MKYYDQKGPSEPAQCPYRRFAQQQAPAGDDLSQFAQMFEKLYEGLLHFDGRTSRYGTSGTCDIAQKYIGNLQQHASLHRQDKRFPEGIRPVASSKHTDLGAMIGDIHARYRQGAKAIGDLLDESRLKPETLKAYAQARNAYRSGVAETKHHSKNGLPHHNLLAWDKKQQLLQNYNAALEALQGSELATAECLPVHTATGMVPNDLVGGQKLGMYLFTLREAAGAQGDANLVPENARKWMASIGIQAAIPKLWEEISQPDFKAEVDAICAETCRLVKERVGTSAHAMQMAHLMLAAKGDTEAAAAAGKLCGRANIAPYPDQLETDQEAAVILEVLQRQSKPAQFFCVPASFVSDRLSSLARKLEEQVPLSATEQDAVRDIAQRNALPEAPHAEVLVLAGTLLDRFMEFYRAPERSIMSGRNVTGTGRRA